MRNPNVLRNALAASMASAIFLFTGCGAGTLAPASSAPKDVGSVHMAGTIFGGQQPITGAAVYLYATSTSDYGAASTSLLTPGLPGVLTDAHGLGYVKTDSSGRFSITGDYTCPSGAMVYLLAIGGNPGLPGTATNPNAALMSALGSCSFLLANAATTDLNVNEVTTIASVWALAPFMSSATAIGTSSAAGTKPGNAGGLANAFATVNNLTNRQYGTSPGDGQPVAGGGFVGLPAGMTVPSDEIYALADILASCINSDPSTSSNCSNLFASSHSSSGAVPTNTVDAALNIAQNPGANVSALFNLIPPAPAFATGLTVVPNDWTIGIRYGGLGITNSNQLAIDSQGNVWTANNAATGGVAVISPQGVRLSGANGYTSGGINTPFAIAIDASDRAWVTNTAATANSISAIDINGTALVGSPFTGGGVTASSSSHGIAIDPRGYVWVTNQASGSGSLSQFDLTGAVVNGPTQIAGGITSTSQPYGVVLDTSNQIWVTNRATNVVSKIVYSTTNNTFGQAAYNSTGRSFSNPFHLAFDGSGNAWVANFGGNTVSKVSSTGVAATGSPFTAGGQILQPAFISIDGLGNVWIANYGTNGCVTELSSTGAQLSPVCYGLGSNPNAHGMAIDTAGNLWVGGNAVTQFVGLAAPVITPIVTATSGNHLATRP